MQNHVDKLAQLFHEQQRLLFGLCKFQPRQLIQRPRERRREEREMRRLVFL
ncbi:unnamed protein product [Callosobruchus maculatus]|uniref:Uncharacterized protein n=1 Tax=Callosobruchus maculatus TaxID=64391 RepID=A0A653DXM2_CALMS|nr:unnamed protein product [Callosobruchus maculatus]